MSPTPTTAVERLKKWIKHEYSAAGWQERLGDFLLDELSRCRREALTEVEGLELMQDEPMSDRYEDTSSLANGYRNFFRKDLRTKLEQLKGEQ